MDLPNRASVVIVGGGIVGCSLAYHLTLRGCTDVVLLERKQLTCGTTWHAAGLVGQLRATYNLTRLAQYTANLYASLEQETGQATGFRQTGSIAVATHAARMEELLRGASMAKCFGLEVQTLTPSEIAAMWPGMHTGDLVGGVFLPKDGRHNPVSVFVNRAALAAQAAADLDAFLLGASTLRCTFWSDAPGAASLAASLASEMSIAPKPGSLAKRLSTSFTTASRTAPICVVPRAR